MAVRRSILHAANRYNTRFARLRQGLEAPMRWNPLRSSFNLLILPILAVAAANLVWFVASAFVEASQKTGDAAPVVYKGARIHTASGPIIERGVMIVVKGKILDVGSEEQVKIPKNAQVRDLTGKVIIPGLVDTH